MLNLNKQFWHDRCLCLIIKILSAAELQQIKDNHVTAKSLRGLHYKEEVSGWRLKGLLGCACIFSTERIVDRTGKSPLEPPSKTNKLHLQKLTDK